MEQINKELHRITRYPDVYPQMEWATPSITAQPQSITALLQRLRGKKAELSSVAHYIPRPYTGKYSPIPVLTRGPIYKIS